MPKNLSIKKETRASYGSITVFLTLIILLILSFVMTSVEAARIKMNSYYFSVLSDISAASYLGTYYYPLFNDYGLLAVDTRAEGSDNKKTGIAKKVRTYLDYSYKNTSGGMIRGENISVTVSDYTSLSDDFYNQIKDEVLYSGAESVLKGVFDIDTLKQTEILPGVYEKQAAAAESAAEISKEILELMTIVDGISTTDTGLMTDAEGNLASENNFLKHLGVGEDDYIKGTYGSTRVYNAVSGKILNVDDMAKRVVSAADELVELKIKCAETEEKISDTEQKNSDAEHVISDTELESLYAECEEKEEELKDGLNLFTESIKYAREKTSEAIGKLSVLILKEKSAKALSDEYENAVKSAIGSKSGFGSVSSSEIFEALLNDATDLKKYVDLKENGYDLNAMTKELTKNLIILNSVYIPDSDNMSPAEISYYISVAERKLQNIKYDNFKFNYKGITTGKKTGVSFDLTFNKIGKEILEFMGVTDISENSLTGLDLYDTDTFSLLKTDIAEAFKNMRSYFDDTDFEGILGDAVNGVTKKAVLNIYLHEYFGSYLNAENDTRLKYEREYVLCGNTSDTLNLSEYALRLCLFRSIFTYAALIANSEKRDAITGIAAMIAGFTGVPALTYVIKYTIMTIWAIMEAIIETAAILSKKKIPFFNASGNMSLNEIFLFNKSLVKQKADAIKSTGVLGETEYLALFLMMQNDETTYFRMLNLIQENIRLKYNDAFRIKNSITGFEFDSQATVKKIFDTGVIGDNAYKVSAAGSAGY